MHSHGLPTWRQPELPNWESWLLRHMWVMSMFLFTFNEKCHIIIMMPVTTVKPKVMVSRLLVLSDHSWELQATVWLLTSWTPLVHVRDLTTYNLRPPKKTKNTETKYLTVRRHWLVSAHHMRNKQLLSDTTVLKDWWEVSAVLHANKAGISLATLFTIILNLTWWQESNKCITMEKQFLI